MIIKNCGLATS